MDLFTSHPTSNDLFPHSSGLSPFYARCPSFQQFISFSGNRRRSFGEFFIWGPNHQHHHLHDHHGDLIRALTLSHVPLLCVPNGIWAPPLFWHVVARPAIFSAFVSDAKLPKLRHTKHSQIQAIPRLSFVGPYFPYLVLFRLCFCFHLSWLLCPLLADFPTPLPRSSPSTTIAYRRRLSCRLQAQPTQNKRYTRPQAC